MHVIVKRSGLPHAGCMVVGRYKKSLHYYFDRFLVRVKGEAAGRCNNTPNFAFSLSKAKSLSEAKRYRKMNLKHGILLI